MARLFQVKRGPKSAMPTLAQGEFGFVTDSDAEQLFIGTGSKNVQFARYDEVAAEFERILGELESNTGGGGAATFIATPNVTTYAEAKAAYDAGKAMYCYDAENDRIGLLYRASEDEICWLTVYYKCLYRYDLLPDNTWNLYDVFWVPAEHAETHATDGTDPISPDDIGAIAKNCVHKESGDVTDLLGTESCRYIFNDVVTGMPIDGKWWFVDVLSNGHADMTLTATSVSSHPQQYIRVCMNNAWGDWIELTGGEASNSFLGENPTGGVTNDTIAFWSAKGPGYCWISETDQVVNQPNQYGFLISYVNDGDVFQIFRDQTDGVTYYRSGDSVNNWFRHWARVITPDSNGNIDVNGIKTYCVEVGDDNSTMGLYTNGLGSKGDAVWIDQAGDAYFTKVNIGTKGNYKQAATQEYVDQKYSYGTEDLTAGTSELETGKLYFVYE